MPYKDPERYREWRRQRIRIRIHRPISELPPDVQDRLREKWRRSRARQREDGRAAVYAAAFRIAHPDYSREWQAAHPDSRRQWLDKHPEYYKEQRRLHPTEIRARHAVSTARKTGRLVPLPCEICSSPGPVDAHHAFGYQPADALAVWWLCKRDHLAMHAFIRR